MGIVVTLQIILRFEIMNNLKKKSITEIYEYNHALRDRFRKIFESFGFKFIPMEELPKDNTNRYEVTFWRKK